MSNNTGDKTVHVETHSSYVEKLAELLSENSAILYLNDKMTYYYRDYCTDENNFSMQLLISHIGINCC